MAGYKITSPDDSHQAQLSASTQDLSDGPPEPHWLYSDDFKIDLLKAAHETPQRPASEGSSGEASEDMRHSITHTSTRIPGNHMGMETGGLDMLQVTVFAELTSEFEEHYLPLVKIADECLEDKQLGEYRMFGRTLTVMDFRFAWAGSSMSVVIEDDGIQVAIAKLGTDVKMCRAKVQIGSYRLMRDGAERSWQSAKELLLQLGLTVIDTTVPRFDVCVDWADMDIEDVLDLYEKNSIITKIRKTFCPYRKASGEGTGLATNGGEIRVNFYDKIKQLETQKGSWLNQQKAQILALRRWGGRIPDKAMRFEFQVRKQWFSKHYKDCRTVEEILNKMPSIVEYLTRTYFRMTVGNVDRRGRNQNKAETSELWSKVQWAFDAWTKSEWQFLERKGLPQMNAPVAINRFKSACVGLLTYAPEQALDPEKAAQYVLDVFQQQMFSSTIDWEEAVEKIKQKRLQANVRGVSGLKEFEETVTRPGPFLVQLLPRLREEEEGTR